MGCNITCDSNGKLQLKEQLQQFFTNVRKGQRKEDGYEKLTMQVLVLNLANPELIFPC